jgi:UDP-glucose 6-dehydrogenase
MYEKEERFHKIIIEKSTVPIGTSNTIKDILKEAIFENSNNA